MKGLYRFINTNIPTEGCNLRCEYCYIIQHGDEDSVLKIRKEDTGSRFRFPIEHMVKALSVERMGGVCMFNISGSGETLLCPEIVDIVYGMLNNGHYVALITNCTVRSEIQKILDFPTDFKQRLFFKVSFHYRELKKRRMLESFVENINMLKSAGIAFSLEVVSSDAGIGEVPELQEFSKEHFGALPHVLTGRDESEKFHYQHFISKHDPEQYNKVWASFNSELFEYQREYDKTMHSEFCYAGVYTGQLLLSTGDFLQCCGRFKKITNFFEDIESPIHFVPIATACPMPDCYASFFYHVLSGASREFNPDVYFHQFRDRICPDGTTWLNPTIREVFSHRCSEFHDAYSPDKEFYITMLMRKVYKGIDPSDDETARLANIVGQSLKGKGYRKIAVYGMGVIGKWLREVLRAANIEVVCAIDRCYAAIKCDVPVQSPDYTIPDVDAIIVSVYAEFTNIAPLLREKTDIPIISIVELGD